MAANASGAVSHLSKLELREKRTLLAELQTQISEAKKAASESTEIIANDKADSRRRGDIRHRRREHRRVAN